MTKARNRRSHDHLGVRRAAADRPGSLRGPVLRRPMHWLAAAVGLLLLFEAFAILRMRA